MMTLLTIAGVIVGGWALKWAYDYIDRGPVNGSGDLPDKPVRNNLDFAEHEFKWDVRPKAFEADGDLRFDVEESDPVVKKIRAQVKR